MTIWAWQFCECGHSKDKHEDEHDEVPTGTGRCMVYLCSCGEYKHDPKAREKGVKDEISLMKTGGYSK